MSEEAAYSIQDWSGYTTDLAQYNAAEIVGWVARDWIPHDESIYKVVPGWQSIVEKLQIKFKDLNGILYTDHKLISTQYTNGDKKFLSFTSGSQVKYYTASKVIYALPQASIQALNPTGPSVSNQFINDINSVQPTQALKIFLAFEYPWWQKIFNFKYGSMIMSAPVKNLFYWGSEQWASNGNINNTNSVLLATYSDDLDATFWSQMLLNSDPGPIYFSNNNWYSQPHQLTDINGTDPRARIVRELMRQIRISHNEQNIPDPFAMTYADWSNLQGPFAWHMWNVGTDPPKIRQRLRNGVNTKGVYVCGEAYSDTQGWVEGSLRSCEKMLIDVFNLDSKWRNSVKCA